MAAESGLPGERSTISRQLKFGNFFAGVINESEIMLEWAAEQQTDTNEDRGVQNLEFVLQQIHTDSSP